MKAWYLAAILMIALIVGCAQEAPPAAPAAEAPPAAPAEEAPPAAPAEEAPPAAPAEGEVAEEAAPAELSDAEQAQVDLLKPACERGSLKSCIALKTRFGIDMQPASAEEPEEPAE